MKRAVPVVLQMILMLVVFLAGSLLPEVHLLPMVSSQYGPGRIFVWDGLLLMVAVYGLILLVATLRKHLVSTLFTSTLALMLALALGLAMKFGFKTL